LHIHSVNKLEVYYKWTSFENEKAARQVLADLEGLGIKAFDGLPADMFFRAGHFKVAYPYLSLGDCICFAFADRLKARVVTADQEFARVRDGAKVSLIR